MWWRTWVGQKMDRRSALSMKMVLSLWDPLMGPGYGERTWKGCSSHMFRYVEHSCSEWMPTATLVLHPMCLPSHTFFSYCCPLGTTCSPVISVSDIQCHLLIALLTCMYVNGPEQLATLATRMYLDVLAEVCLKFVLSSCSLCTDLVWVTFWNRHTISLLCIWLHVGCKSLKQL